MSRITKFAMALVGSVALMGMTASPSSAVVTMTFNVTDNPAGGDGAAQTWGSITWKDSTHYSHSRYTKDVCPGDDHSALSWIQQYGDRVAVPDNPMDVWHSGASGCGNSTYTSGTWGDSFQQQFDWNEIWRVRFCVKVDNGGNPTCSGWKDNPYSNDPSRDGM